MSALAVGVAAALEAAVGEPPTRYHPVAWFGSLVAPLDQEWRSDAHAFAAGGLGALVLPLFAALAVGASVALAETLSPMAGALAAGLALFLTTSLRELLVAARSVVADSETDPEAARDGLLALVGRDAAGLSPGLLRSAAVESAAENLADGLVASLGAFVLGAALAPLAGLPALPVAAAVAAWVKAVNTMDSMLGYRSKRVGTPAARLDDAVMWLPARASALLLAVAFADPRSLVRARGWLSRVSSPNSGWPMGAVAAALDARLEKPGVYLLNASADLPDRTAAQRGVRGVGRAGLLAYALGGVLAWF
nr:CobD/CbiB family cobalamin biosynthesis protein [Halomicroarcula limicola]